VTVKSGKIIIDLASSIDSLRPPQTCGSRCEDDISRGLGWNRWQVMAGWCRAACD